MESFKAWHVQKIGWQRAKGEEDVIYANSFCEILD